MCASHLGVAGDVRVAEVGHVCGGVVGKHVFLNVQHGAAPVVVGRECKEREVPAEHGVARDAVLGLVARFERKVAGGIQEAAFGVQGVADGAAKGNHLCLYAHAILKSKESQRQRRVSTTHGAAPHRCRRR